MAINLTDFDKIWASTSPLTPYAFSDANYQQGWNFVGSTPPARQMWDSYMKWSDEKQQYIVNNFLPLSGGTMTGNIFFNETECRVAMSASQNEESRLRILGGSGISNGAQLLLSGKSHSSTAGQFQLSANDGTNSASLFGKPDGTLTWDGKNVERVNAIGSDYIRYESGLQVCWDAIGNVTTDGKAVTFPVAFNSSPTVFSTGSGNYITWANSVTTTTCNVRISSGTNTVKYLAIGSWK